MSEYAKVNPCEYENGSLVEYKRNGVTGARRGVLMGCFEKHHRDSGLLLWKCQIRDEITGRVCTMSIHRILKVIKKPGER